MFFELSNLCEKSWEEDLKNLNYENFESIAKKIADKIVIKFLRNSQNPDDSIRRLEMETRQAEMQNARLTNFSLQNFSIEPQELSAKVQSIKR